MDYLVRCRGCPRCGSSKYVRVAQSFAWGTWKQCTKCGQQYRPAPSRITIFAAILFGSLFLVGGIIMIPAVRAFTDPIGIIAIVFVLGGLMMILLAVAGIVRYLHTPKGPIAEQSKGFPVLQDHPPPH